MKKFSNLNSTNVIVPTLSEENSTQTTLEFAAPSAAASVYIPFPTFARSPIQMESNENNLYIPALKQTGAASRLLAQILGRKSFRNTHSSRPPQALLPAPPPFPRRHCRPLSLSPFQCHSPPKFCTLQFNYGEMVGVWYNQTPADIPELVVSRHGPNTCTDNI